MVDAEAMGDRRMPGLHPVDGASRSSSVPHRFLRERRRAAFEGDSTSVEGDLRPGGQAFAALPVESGLMTTVGCA
ncbi:hypothetical protein GCM10022252_34170 [Streptosporangium oxazolinicum]|uniref:Uncharacterized protein n=1 Tax=Streptosporangium oxazolinicum TaxID=909287 RepID=A0ABP8AWX2_9ACTN